MILKVKSFGGFSVEIRGVEHHPNKSGVDSDCILDCIKSAEMPSDILRKFYFAGSIRGGREDVELYRQLIDYLQTFGNVLTEHIGLDSLKTSGTTTVA